MIYKSETSIFYVFMSLFLLFITFYPSYAKKIKQEWLQGYQKTIEGVQMNYHFLQGDMKNALICRCKKEYNKIKWSAQGVPKDFNADSASFIWPFAINTTPFERHFTLDINGIHHFQISTPTRAELKETTFKSKEGGTLTFKITSLDRYNDCFGYAIVTLPLKGLPREEALTFEISAEINGENTWFITYEEQIENKGEVSLLPAILKGEKRRKQLLQLKITHLNKSEELKVSSSLIKSQTLSARFGYNSFQLEIDEIDSPVDDTINVQSDNDTLYKIPVKVRPAQRKEIFLVQHTHTDIGYTRNATEILADHLRYMDYALDYCDLTDDLPDDARFHWTCESLWAVQEYLLNRPESQINRLLERIKEGRIEVTAMLFNMSDLTDENLYRFYLKPLKLLKNKGIPVTCAMQNDVNGASWCLIDYFNSVGTRYLTMGQHGHRALSPFDVPTAFWWKSRSGKRVMAFRADHYNTGNNMGIHLGNLETVEKNIFKYLLSLEEKKYPLQEISMQFSGYFTDNSPPSMKACELVHQWNEKYEYPKLKLTTASDFLSRVENKYGKQLDSYQKAWPDWWTDGFGSAAYETALCRKNQGLLSANQNLLSFLALQGNVLPYEYESELDHISSSLLFYNEHTFGAAESISAPLCENSYRQWMEKASFVYEASKKNRLLTEKAMGILQNQIPKRNVPSLIVFNPSLQKRRALLDIYIDHELLPLNRPFKMIDSKGRQASAQAISSRTDGTCWKILTGETPPLGYETYQIIVDTKRTSQEAPSLSRADILENDFYRLRINKKGEITSIYDKESHKEFIDPKPEYEFGSIIYEELGNRAQMERYTLTDFHRNKLTNIKLLWAKNGPIWKSCRFSGINKTKSGEDRFEWEIRLYHDIKEISLQYKVKKQKNLAPEGYYISFPFHLKNGKNYFETQGAFAEAGKDQLPGSSLDWQSTQNLVSVNNGEEQIIMSCNEIPLVQFGGINTGNFQYEAKEYPNNHIYSWIMNNYWTTNFRPFQEGEWEWTYHITSTKKTSFSQTARFGQSRGLPSLARILPKAPNGRDPEPVSLISEDYPNLILTSSKPGKRHIILQLRETNGESAQIQRQGLFLNQISRANVIGDEIKIYEENETINISPFETVWLKIQIEENDPPLK